LLGDRRETWRLIASVPSSDTEESQCLSLTRYGILSDIQPAHEVAAALFDCVREGAPFHTTAGPGQKAVMAAPTPQSSIRVNRTAGPFGHLTTGADFNMYRTTLCDVAVTGALPRRWTAVILVPMADGGGAIVSVVPFYVAVRRGGANARVVIPRHTAVPRRGFVAHGAGFGQATRAHARREALVEATRRFTATTYDGALLLADLCAARPELAVSPTAVGLTLRNHEVHWQHFTEGPGPSSRVRSAVVGPYQLGDHVFVRLGGGGDDDDAADDDWWAAIVEKVHRNDTVAVRLALPEEEGGEATIRVSIASVRPDGAYATPATRAQQG